MAQTLAAAVALAALVSAAPARDAGAGGAGLFDQYRWARPGDIGLALELTPSSGKATAREPLNLPIRLRNLADDRVMAFFNGTDSLESVWPDRPERSESHIVGSRPKAA